ncbi:MAG: RNA polymerase sigma factor, RpoD/SigA family, partial [Phormidesmis sp. CAN_BIN44]|nr:RNA polymerase sigma factor, RpoD/SigA family [Phormidesmis sp. CAN_BIN44]
MKTAQTPTDSVRAYLREFGRVPLLSHEQEILYGMEVERLSLLNRVNEEMALTLDREPNLSDWLQKSGLSEAEIQQSIVDGETAKRRMV